MAKIHARSQYFSNVEIGRRSALTSDIAQLDQHKAGHQRWHALPLGTICSGLCNQPVFGEAQPVGVNIHCIFFVVNGH